VLLVADRLCRERRAMLIVDSPAAWQTGEDALRGLREFDFRSDHALLCFPRINAHDRLRGRTETFANCGAVAGALARMDELRSPWEAGPDQEILLRPGARPAHVCTEAERHSLAAHGINALQSLRTASPRALPLKTLAGGTAASADQGLLTPQRRRLLLMGSIERGTRWVVFEAADRGVWQKVERQVQAFLRPLGASGVFGPQPAADDCQVVCDERVNGPEDVAAGRVNILVSVPSGRLGRYQSFLVTHARDGSRVRPARSNLLPVGTRMTVEGLPAQVPPDDTQRQRTLAQELFGHYREPRAEPSAVAGSHSPIPPAAGRLDPETIARIHRDFGSRLQRF
jgi:hypothetical protein